MGNATSIATKNGNERPISNMENTTSIATKDEKERPFSSTETSTLVMDDFREKVGFVTFVKSGVDDEHDEESTEKRNFLQSGWPAIIFDSLEDFEHHKVNLKNKLSNKAAISEAGTDILNYRKQLFQAGQRFSDVNHRHVAFLLDVDVLPKKKQRLIFDDETNVLNFATTVEAWHYLKDNYSTSNIASAPFQVDARNSKKNQGTTVLRDVSNEMGIPTLTETKKRKGNSTYNLRSRHYNNKGSSKSAIDTSNEDAVKSPRRASSSKPQGGSTVGDTDGQASGSNTSSSSKPQGGPTLRDTDEQASGSNKISTETTIKGKSKKDTGGQASGGKRSRDAPLSSSGTKKIKQTKQSKQDWLDKMEVVYLSLDEDNTDAFKLFYEPELLFDWKKKFQKAKLVINDDRDSFKLMKYFMGKVFGSDMLNQMEAQIIRKANVAAKPEAVQSNDCSAVQSKRLAFFDRLVDDVTKKGSTISLYPFQVLDKRSELRSSLAPIYLIGEESSDEWELDEVRAFRRKLGEMLQSKLKIGTPLTMLEIMRNWMGHHASPFHPRLSYVPCFDNTTLEPNATSTYDLKPPSKTNGGPEAFCRADRKTWGRAMKTGEKYFELLKIFIADPRKHLTDKYSTPRDVFLIIIAATVKAMTKRKLHYGGKSPGSSGAAQNHDKIMQQLFDHCNGGVLVDDDGGVDDDANLKNDDSECDSEVMVQSDMIQFRKYFDIRLIATWLVWWKFYLEDKTYESLNLSDKSKYPEWARDKGIKDTDKFITELRLQEALVEELRQCQTLNDTIDTASSVSVPHDIEDWNEDLIKLLGYEKIDPVEVQATNNEREEAMGGGETEDGATGPDSNTIPNTQIPSYFDEDSDGWDDYS